MLFCHPVFHILLEFPVYYTTSAGEKATPQAAFSPQAVAQGIIPAQRGGPIVSGRIAQPALRNHCIIRHRQWQINRECLRASGIYTEKHPGSSSLPGFMEQGYKDSNLEMTES